MKAGISPASAHKLVNSGNRAIRLDHIELLCDILLCEPNDILLFTPDNGRQYAPNSPLLKLVQEQAGTPLHHTIAVTPYKELKKISKAVLDTQ